MNIKQALKGIAKGKSYRRLAWKDGTVVEFRPESKPAFPGCWPAAIYRTVGGCSSLNVFSPLETVAEDWVSA